jgi:hypothetical protein
MHAMPCVVRASALALMISVNGASLHAQQHFPERWAGRWEGTLTTMSPPDSVRNRISISLTIAREDTGTAWSWRTIFNADTVRGIRPYRLIVRDVARGLFATDEGNGLELEEVLIGETLVSVFQVDGRLLESRYAMHGDSLIHDIIWWSTTPAPRRSGKGPNAERGSEVRSFRVEGRQRAVMTRKN